MNARRYWTAQIFCLLVLGILTFWLFPCRTRVLAVGQASGTSASRSGNFDGPAELPRSYVDSSLRATPAPGKTLTVRAGEDPSQALAKASCGDTIQLEAGATFGKLLLPEKKCDDSHWIIFAPVPPIRNCLRRVRG